MPITEYRPSFLVEAWALYGIGTAILFLRFSVRIRTVGFRGFQGDDFFAALVIMFYAIDAMTVHLIYHWGTNMEASVIMKTSTLSAHDIVDFTKGSKLELTAWYSYTALIWCLKGTMLCFFSRMTIGTWHNMFVKAASVICALGYLAVFLTITFGCFPIHRNWQVVPSPGAQCTFRMQNLIVTTVFNIITDALIFCIPLPLLWKLQVPPRKKIVIGLLLSSGLFVISAAIIRVVLTLSGAPNALTINSWGVRETIVGILTVNIPVIRPIFKKSFWTGGPPTHSTTLRTTTLGGKSADITGPYELTTSINDGAADSNRVHSSQESIVGKSGFPNSVMVRTTYAITHEQGVEDDESWYERNRGNKASAHAQRTGV